MIASNEHEARVQRMFALAAALGLAILIAGATRACDIVEQRNTITTGYFIQGCLAGGGIPESMHECKPRPCTGGTTFKLEKNTQ